MWTGVVLRDIAFRATVHRRDLLAIAFFDIGDELPISPVLAEVSDKGQFVCFGINKRGLLLYDRRGVKKPKPAKDLGHKYIGVQESQNYLYTHMNQNYRGEKKVALCIAIILKEDQKMREPFCSKEYIDRKLKFIEEQLCLKEKRIASIEEDTKKGVQRHSKRNEDIIFDVKIKCFQLIYELIRTQYSYGMNCDELEVIYLKGVEFVRVIGYERIGYVDFLQFFCAGILIELDKEKMDAMVQIADRQGLNDVIFDFLVSSCGLKRTIVSSCFQREKPYKDLVPIIDAAVADKHKASALLREYVEKKWIQGHSDLGWEDARKKAGHIGLWSFDAAALSKIIGLNDEELSGNNHYPYDLSHYKTTQKFVINLSSIYQIEDKSVSDQSGIPENEKLEQIVPPQFHELVNQIIRDYSYLDDYALWEKYGLCNIWFDIEEYNEEKTQKSLLGTIIINQLVERGYILQLDYKENVREYIDSIENFWNVKEFKLISFDLDNDQNYYALVPKNAMLEFIYEVCIDETTI